MEKKKISSLQWIYSYSRSSLGWILLLAVFSGLIAGSFILLALVSSCLLDIATGSREGSVWLQVLFLVMLILLQAVLNKENSKGEYSDIVYYNLGQQSQFTETQLNKIGRASCRERVSSPV